MSKITKEMKISDILELGADKVAPIFFSFGMGCLGCAMASGETLEEACQVHGINVDEIVGKLETAVQ